jgi:acid phosphatase family membrane protein YuiD
MQGKYSIAFVWNTIVLLMMAGFLASIITSMAQGFLMEKQKQEMAALTELLSHTETERCQDSKDC